MFKFVDDFSFFTIAKTFFNKNFTLTTSDEACEFNNVFSYQGYRISTGMSSSCF